MRLRPATTTWFELLTPREELAAVLRCLADSGQVELQARSDPSAAHRLPALRVALDEFRHLAQRYAPYWPGAANRPVSRDRTLEAVADAALKCLRTWAAGADPLVVRLQTLASEQTQLQLWLPLLSQTDVPLPNLRLFAQPGPVLASRAYWLSGEPGVLEVPAAVLTQTIGSKEGTYLLAVGPVREIDTLEEGLSARKAQRLDVPSQLPAERAGALTAVAERGAQIAAQVQQLQAQLAQLSRSLDCAGALADLRFIEWLLEHVPQLSGTGHFAWITGWTSDPSGARLQAALQRAQLHCLLRFPEAPSGITRPVVLRNPRWAQPFELFARLLGMPAAGEADPSAILALIVPLLFGFMFGDVGQGALLIVAGATLRRRYPTTALLIPGGIAAMLFGVLFGSVFAREDLLPALWLHPLDRPLTLLGVSLAGGSGVILLGLALEAAESYWAGAVRLWWSARAGLVLCYLGVICSVLDRRTLWALPAGLAWYWVGGALGAPSGRRIGRLGVSVGESLETLMQLMVNTFSFVRVGAFALAHAGLAAAVSGLAAGIGSRAASWAVLLVGNALLIVIEGMVVAIQTTRLVLFEFFIRFLRGSGRAFRPLSGPSDPTNTIQPSRNSP